MCFQSSYILNEVGCILIRMNKLEELLGDKYPNIPWKQARKMRNIIIHDYDHVDFEKVYYTSTKDLPLLKQELFEFIPTTV